MRCPVQGWRERKSSPGTVENRLGGGECLKCSREWPSGPAIPLQVSSQEKQEDTSTKLARKCKQSKYPSCTNVHAKCGPPARQNVTGRLKGMRHGQYAREWNQPDAESLPRIRFHFPEMAGTDKSGEGGRALAVARAGGGV